MAGVRTTGGRLGPSKGDMRDRLPQKSIAVRRKFVYKTQFNRCCRSLAILRRQDRAKAFHIYRFGHILAAEEFAF
jgi:hypothetical protein